MRKTKVVPSFPLKEALINNNKVLPSMTVDGFRAAMFNCNLALCFHPKGTPEQIQERIDNYNKAHDARGNYLPPTPEELG